MNTNDNNKFLELAESLGWSFNICDRHDGEVCVELEKYSPAGQDFIATIWFKDGDEDDFRARLGDYATDFDPDEEAAKWISPDGHGVNGAPRRLSEILADMQSCKKMLLDLYNAYFSKRFPETAPLFLIGDTVVWHDPDPSRPWYENDLIYEVVGIKPDGCVELRNDWFYAEAAPDECEPFTFTDEIPDEDWTHLVGLRTAMRNLCTAASNFSDSALHKVLRSMAESCASQMEQAITNRDSL